MDTLREYNGKTVVIDVNWKRDEAINNVANYFTEQCRIQCRKEGKRSIAELWQEHPGGTREQFLRKHKDSVCSNFNVVVALNILEFFKARRWLDISAGWGDRLAAAIG